MNCTCDSCKTFEMIAGSRKIFRFNVVNKDGDEFRLSAYKARFALSYLLNRSMTPVLVKDMTVERESNGRATGLLSVTLESEDTISLVSGKYVYQIMIYNTAIKHATVSQQGDILIYDNIDKNFLAEITEGEQYETT